MKKRIFFFSMFVVLSSQICLAQLSISTYKRIDAYWNDSKEDWVITSEDENATLFEFNKEFTMFKHTTSNISSTYYIKSSSYDKYKERYELSITSDVGNKYTMIIDIANKNLRFIYAKSGTTYAVQHSIKNSWTED
jgi:hypothetical protein